jgi:hypothetical protein
LVIVAAPCFICSSLPNRTRNTTFHGVMPFTFGISGAPPNRFLSCGSLNIMWGLPIWVACHQGSHHLYDLLMRLCLYKKM